MARRIIVVEDVDGDITKLDEAVNLLQEAGLKAYFASSTFSLPHLSEAAIQAQTETNLPDAVALQTLLSQKSLLEEELRKYRMLLANSGDLMYAFDYGGTVTYVTPNVQNWLGYRPDEVINQSFLNFIPPELHWAAVQQFERVTGNENYSFPANLLTRDSRYIPVEISSRTLFEDNVPVLHIGVARNVTERKRMEEEMHKRNRELGALYSVASVLNQSLETQVILQTCLERMTEALEADTGGIVLVGPQGQFTLSAAHGMDNNFSRLITPLADEPLVLKRVLQEGEVVFIEELSELPMLDHTLLAQLGHHAFAIGPLRAKDRVMGAFFLARKAKKSFTEADRELILSVGQQVGMALEMGELYAELNNTINEVRQANARLEEATRHKSEFLANMSHELRTPLNAIIGFSEILQDQSFGPLNPKQERYVTNILTSGKNLLALVNDVLDLSKVEAGKMELGFEEFDLRDAINDVLTIVSVMAEKKQMGLSIRHGDYIGDIRADRGKLKQILYNLLSNAIKFTPEGGTVEIHTQRAGSNVEISVIDTGIGIKSEDFERIFEEFRMLDSVLTKKQQGTGLGLALSRRLAQLHGGNISLLSELGKGSIFTLSIPIDSSKSDKAENFGPVTEPRPATTSPAPLVLIVEDDDKAAELLQLYMEQNGYRVARATNGESALAQAKSLKPNLISLDIVLPTRNGWEILRELKDEAATRDIPVMVISMVDNRQVSFDLGAVACFVKPVRREELAAKLNDLKLDELHRRRQRHLTQHLQQGAALEALVIDDNPHDRELISTTLSAAGLNVTTAADGETGWQLARQKPPDLVVLDLMMPQTDGFEVLTRLRQNLATLDVPVFVYTAKDLDEQERTRLNYEAEVILQKGDSRQNLLDAVNRLTPNS